MKAVIFIFLAISTSCGIFPRTTRQHNGNVEGFIRDVKGYNFNSAIKRVQKLEGTRFLYYHASIPYDGPTSYDYTEYEIDAIKKTIKYLGESFTPVFKCKYHLGGASINIFFGTMESCSNEHWKNTTFEKASEIIMGFFSGLSSKHDPFFCNITPRSCMEDTQQNIISYLKRFKETFLREKREWGESLKRQARKEKENLIWKMNNSNQHFRVCRNNEISRVINGKIQAATSGIKNLKKNKQALVDIHLKQLGHVKHSELRAYNKQIRLLENAISTLNLQIPPKGKVNVSKNTCRRLWEDIKSKSDNTKFHFDI